MRKSSAPKDLTDDLNYSQLIEGLKKNIEQLKASIPQSSDLQFGPYHISKPDYIEALGRLVSALETDPSGAQFQSILASDFQTLEVFGSEDWSEVFITSYYEPYLEGSLKKTKKFSQALYEPPADMVYVDVSAFSRAFSDLMPMEALVGERSRDRYLRGRVESTLSPVARTLVVPYFSREQIDSAKDFRKKARVICYVDPVDAFFLHIQGSGTVHLTNGEKIRVGYAGQNGHSYQAIGKYLFDVIPKEQISAQKIEEYLRGLNPDEQQKLMNLNPSYVFFKPSKGGAITYFGTEAVDGRTIATDTKYFPKGALAFLEFEKPEWQKNEAGDDVVGFKTSRRFVIDQDTGGAIRGPHRVDLFWGRGPEAAQMSGVMKHAGRLHYFIPRTVK